MLLEAAGRCELPSGEPPRAFVRLKKLADFAVTYEVNVYCTDITGDAPDVRGPAPSHPRRLQRVRCPDHDARLRRRSRAAEDRAAQGLVHRPRGGASPVHAGSGCLEPANRHQETHHEQDRHPRVRPHRAVVDEGRAEGRAVRPRLHLRHQGPRDAGRPVRGRFELRPLVGARRHEGRRLLDRRPGHRLRGLDEEPARLEGARRRPGHRLHRTGQHPRRGPGPSRRRRQARARERAEQDAGRLRRRAAAGHQPRDLRSGQAQDHQHGELHDQRARPGGQGRDRELRHQARPVLDGPRLHEHAVADRPADEGSPRFVGRDREHHPVVVGRRARARLHLEGAQDLGQGLPGARPAPAASRS